MVVAYTRNHPTVVDSTKAPSFVGAGVLLSQFCQVDVTAAFVANDLIDLFYLPKNAIPVGGYLSLVDIDTGTETLDLDVGITANGVDSADADFFSNSGVLTGDAIATDLPLTNAANLRLFLGPFPVLQLGAKTLVQLKCIAASNAGHTGKLCVRVDYILPGVATS